MLPWGKCIMLTAYWSLLFFFFLSPTNINILMILLLWGGCRRMRCFKDLKKKKKKSCLGLGGHRLLTHFYLLKGEKPPVCIPCDQLCSVEHLLTECVDLIEWRRHFFFKTESLTMLFRECSPANIAQFLKQSIWHTVIALFCTLS